MNSIHSSHVLSVFSIRRDYTFLLGSQRARRNGQAGTALVMALVILMILTILGISSMKTSIMEERMSGNIQDLNRAFEAAESGLSRAFKSNDFNPGTTLTISNIAFGTGATATKADVTATHVGTKENIPGYSLGAKAAMFDVVSTGTTSVAETGAQIELHQGIGQIMGTSE